MLRIRFSCSRTGEHDAYIAADSDGIQPRHHAFVAMIDCAGTNRLYMDDPQTGSTTLVLKNHWAGVDNYSITVLSDA